MTIIEQIKAEIERRHAEWQALSDKGNISVDGLGAKFEDENILSFLSTLESENPTNQEGLEKEIERFIPNINIPDKEIAKEIRLSRRQIAIHFAKWGAEHLADDRKTSTNDLEEAASRFSKNASNEHNRQYLRVGFVFGAKWMKKQMLKDGLDAVKTCDFNKVEKTIAGVFVDYGMRRQKDQLMKEAVEGEFILNPYPTICLDDCKDYNFKEEQKVRVIILPKED